MLRFSEKAQLVWQLQDMWLAYTLVDTVIDNKDMLQRILLLGATYSKNQLHCHDWPYAGSSRGLLGEGEKELVGWMDGEMDLVKEEGGAMRRKTWGKWLASWG